MERKKPKKMLLFGPGYGHNVEAKLRRLNKTTLFDVTFLAYNFDEKFRSKYPNIRYVLSHFELNKRHPWRAFKNIWWLFMQVRCSGHYDVVYSLGMGDVMCALIFWMAKENVKKAIEIWSIHIIKSAKQQKGFSGKFDAYVLKKADLVFQYWWGIRERFVNAFPEYEQKFVTYNLSYPDIYFSGEKHTPESNFVKDFLAKIPKEQIYLNEPMRGDVNSVWKFPPVYCYNSRIDYGKSFPNY